ncbi:phytoene/squalene synthase family protein [Paraconexibacter algicola]|uniref:Phytoene synthase n=1 Tax=Paraconexibacter algicola TaxID=2133960 RepID=A0A2T4UEU3_9ACTN|nr:phytoene/squalene synthase family protein [Paraconexibacter algicola]PTL56242.1 phytoene synthase [Paraconexibacter algicola]
MDDITATDPALRQAYARCRRLQRRHDPTFYVATSCLPRRTRPAVHALYGFVRGADELVDGPGAPQDPEERRRALDRWEQTLREGVVAGRSEHPVIAALVDAAQRVELPLEQLGPYMDSMRVDCGPVRIPDGAALDRYMDGSAAAVGRLMTPLLEAPAELREEIAALGIAFQLTNFVRDVAEDWTLDRVYLPGLPEEDLARGLVTDRVRETVARDVSRARALFARTAAVADELRPSMRPGVRVARAVYLRVLDRIEARNFDVLRPGAGSLWPTLPSPRGAT